MASNGPPTAESIFGGATGNSSARYEIIQRPDGSVWRVDRTTGVPEPINMPAVTKPQGIDVRQMPDGTLVRIDPNEPDPTKAITVLGNGAKPTTPPAPHVEGGYVSTYNPTSGQWEMRPDPVSQATQQRADAAQARQDQQAGIQQQRADSYDQHNQDLAQHYQSTEYLSALHTLMTDDWQRLTAQINAGKLDQDTAQNIFTDRWKQAIDLPQAVTQSQQNALTVNNTLANTEGTYDTNRANNSLGMGRDYVSNLKDTMPYTVGAGLTAGVNAALSAPGGINPHLMQLGPYTPPDFQGAYNRGSATYMGMTPAFGDLRTANPVPSYQPTAGQLGYVQQAQPQPVDWRTLNSTIGPYTPPGGQPVGSAAA